MSRLFDRIRADGTRALRVTDFIVATPDRLASFVAARPEGASEDHESVHTALTKVSVIRAKDALRPGELPEMLVVVADNVGSYFAEVHTGVIAVSTIVSTLLPPFRRMFVDIQGAPNEVGFKAWGVEFETIHDPENPNPAEPMDAWVVEAKLFAEWRTGEPVGPVGRYIIPLDAQGRARGGDGEGYGTLFGGVVELPGIPDDARQDAHQFLLRPLAAALLTLSFMHCKNVDVSEVVPPVKLSKKHLRKHGVPLTTYRVLEIDPMRRILSREGNAESVGLRQALHICRGHFKTFTEEAPLFGRSTGTYWWAEQLRGDRQRGVVLKDYRIKIDEAGLGHEYQRLDEHPQLAQAGEHKGRDPDLAGRACMRTT